MAITHGCNIDTLLSNAKCFLEQCTSENEREGLLIYMRVWNLLEGGGPDYTNIDTLLTAAKSWQPLSHAQLKAMEMYIARQNAIENGAGAQINVGIDALKAAAKCFMCLPKMTREQLLMFLYCQISVIEVSP